MRPCCATTVPQVPHSDGVGHVTRESTYRIAFALDDAESLLGSLAIYVHADNVRTVSREQDGCSLAVARSRRHGACAEHNGDLALQAAHRTIPRNARRGKTLADEAGSMVDATSYITGIQSKSMARRR